MFLVKGTFSEIENLIRSISQLLFDRIKNTEDKFWIWLMEIRKFLKFVNMFKISDSQIDQMNTCLETMMNLRLQLTKVELVPVENIIDTVSIDELIMSHTSFDESDSEDNKTSQPKVKKYSPPVTFKEPFLSHFGEDIRDNP